MRTKIKGILSRYIKNRGKEKEEISGCKEKMDIEFLRFTINWNKTKREFVKEILDRNKEKNIMVFKNRTQLNKWYEKEFSEKMEI